MTRWDDNLKQYNHVVIRALCGGRFRCGHPPSVGEVDVMLPSGSHLLRDKDCIAQIEASDGTFWTLAIQGVSEEDIYEHPNGKQVLVGGYLVCLDKTRAIQELPLSFITGVITDSETKSLYVFNTYHLICFGEQGMLWEYSGLFDGDMHRVSLRDDRVECIGSLNWIDADKDFKIILEPTTGAIVGGDAEAVAHHRD